MLVRTPGVDSLRSPFGRTACVCRRFAPRLNRDASGSEPLRYVQFPSDPRSWCAARDSNAEASSFELLRYAVPVSCAWCGPPESNRDANGFKPSRYSCSLQVRNVGSRPRSRTEKHLFLRQVGMPNSRQTALMLARRRGFEPRSRESKSRVLPLNEHRLVFGTADKSRTCDLDLRKVAL